ncbi:Protein jagged-1a,Fibropellin-1,Neurogenic locus notch homolog protein 2,Protein jagged-1b,Neurogenic locus notch homolog protein 1,Delta-like protein B,Fibropellin-3,Neurogenic locus notch homolog protein 4,Protein crumbs homolog 2,Protein jagged-2,Neurogenic locus notch homolog protein 3,Protein eyes shut homolog,Delta-like protein C,Protein jagged-1,Neurogenic locus Notch protein,Delta-like protein A,Delta-like protein 1 [Mytilus edulis]|uniref:EGF-like domain-containing protein n=1 Tax=Mytilus edulis TaxID=6550 RepID=A0A8S3VLB6_MYTED|nr:Protein jagged-1a,Fibropellin-1,Neurogenic locus notch homolog protein 2,Protein jagged-1b,Neurogenic locus notch homolog protein 1,Delta-like protein B,Fibropellin-3,Neurogenic locus notch homolog protein 4,Protein crumbs homolog 2,Protein jagged-2,Neurogenic locus notch homolog protein 3,Protein eyes shut homolog,Delta-like protein C,Protein jagged-1,Neurogenic locus Notch protein,Delta-like protein A,Delta-like protein 1 [Mytilus edulis]
MKLAAFFVFIGVNFRVIFANFLGGTVSWEPIGLPPSTQVNLHGRYGFQYGKGPGCGVTTPVGSLTRGLVGGNSLACTQGCTPSQNITMGDLNYYCASFLKSDWEQGDEFINHTFPSTDKFTVSYTGSPWIHHDYGTTGNVYFQTTIDLRVRNDTKRPNSSPVTSSLPQYQIPFDCITSIQLPVYDPDEDVTSCRWSAGVECGGVCNGLPESKLDSQRCILTIQPKTVTGFVHNGTYIITLTVEDSPRTTITVGSSTVNPNTALSQVPLQFVVKTVKVPTTCYDIPQITNPTPSNGQVFIVPTGETFKQKIYAKFNSPAVRIQNIVTSVPYQTSNTPLHNEGGQVYSTEFSWKPKPIQYSTNIICFQAVDDRGLYSEQHCFTLLAGVEDPCTANPCEHGGSCQVQLDSFVCTCTPEYEGRNCSIDINDCLSSPCKSGGTCWDQVGGYKCFCPIGFMGHECLAIDYCASSPCHNFGTCTTTNTSYTCTCGPGYSGHNCNIDLDECASSPCENGGTCTDMVGDFFCECPIEYKGKNCSTPHDFCNPNPCANNGLCTNYKDSYRCSCPSGYIGLDCEIYQPESCGVDDDNHCMCLLNGRRVKLPFPQPKAEGFSTDDLIAGVVGIPIGIATGLLMCVLWHKLIRPRCFNRNDSVRGPRSRPSSTSSDRSLLSRSTASPSEIRASVHSPISTISDPPSYTNLYRNNRASDWSPR